MEKNIPGVKDLLKESITIFKQKYQILVPIVALPFGLNFVFSYALQSGVSFGLVTILLMIVLGIFLIISSIWYMPALVYGLVSDKSFSSFVQCYKDTKNKIWGYIWISILTSAIIAGGMILFIIPGIYFSIAVSFFVFVFIIENINGLNALLRSIEYTKGKWWAIFGRILVLLIIMWVLSMIIGAVSSLIFPKIFSSLIITALQIFLTPFAIIYNFLIYNNLKKSYVEAIPEPTKKSRRLLIATAIIGVLVTPVVFILLTSFIFNSVKEGVRDTTLGTQQGLEQLQR